MSINGDGLPWKSRLIVRDFDPFVIRCRRFSEVNHIARAADLHCGFDGLKWGFRGQPSLEIAALLMVDKQIPSLAGGNENRPEQPKQEWAGRFHLSSLLFILAILD